jgi:hypothetical protein
MVCGKDGTSPPSARTTDEYWDRLVSVSAGDTVSMVSGDLRT